MKSSFKSNFILYLILLLLTVWMAVLIAPCLEAEGNIITRIGAIPDYLMRPFQFVWLPVTGKYVGAAVIIYLFTALYLYAGKRKTRNGEEHGSAVWGNVEQLNQKYAEKKEPAENVILTKGFRIGLDGYKHRHNLNVLVVGGSGAGKTRFYVKPNLLQANTSFLVTDPKGELLRSAGGYLQSKGYEIRVLDLLHPESSMCYNPFIYLTRDDDVLSLISNFVRNTTPKEAKSSDPFWEKSETALLQSLMLYLWHEAPPDEQNFEMILNMLNAMDADDDYTLTPVDCLMEELRKKNPDHVAVKQYDVFKKAKGKTSSSIVVSAAVRLSQFGMPGIARMTARDEMDFPSIGQHKVALFCVIPDIDKSYNWLVSMLYTQAFQQLEHVADEKTDGRLPVHVHCLLDEFANIPLPEAFENVLATARSREISISIILQNLAQLKALFDKQWESIVGNCDEFLYLGGNEQSTHKYVSELIGKETIDTTSYSLSRGRNGHYSTSYQRAGRELLTPSEVRRISRKKAILFVASEPPVMDDKYDLSRHPAIKQTVDGGAPVFNYRIGLARMFANGLRPDDYEILLEDPDEPEEANKPDQPDQPDEPNKPKEKKPKKKTPQSPVSPAA